MKIAVVGGRDFTDYDLVKSSILDNYNLDDLSEVVSGGAKGADSLGAKFAKEYNLKLTEFKPDWKKYGRGAGFVRNKLIIEHADVVFAFWDGKSKGTANSINIAKRSNKTLRVISYGQHPQLF